MNNSIEFLSPLPTSTILYSVFVDDAGRVCKDNLFEVRFGATGTDDFVASENLNVSKMVCFYYNGADRKTLFECKISRQLNAGDTLSLTSDMFSMKKVRPTLFDRFLLPIDVKKDTYSVWTQIKSILF